jgi:hypothetical protein
MCVFYVEIPHQWNLPIILTVGENPNLDSAEPLTVAGRMENNRWTSAKMTDLPILMLDSRRRLAYNRAATGATPGSQSDPSRPPARMGLSLDGPPERRRNRVM